MTENNPVNNRNIVKAHNFLKAFRGDGYMNLVAIHPQTGHVIGMTAPVGADDIHTFIQDHIEYNQYFMVNEPFPDAPNNKLKKLHVHKIHAVWLDADPDKDKDFDEERIRLLKIADELKNSEHPPTYIVDSGGGIQTFWVLNVPIDATKENVELYESLSRGLAVQYGTDSVHNIDRIMRIPYTNNIPTKKKQGRQRTTAKLYWAASQKGIRYD